MTGDVSPVLMELFSLITAALLGADLALTVSALTDFNRMAQNLEQSLNQHMEEIVSSMDDRIQRTGNWLAEERERFSRESIERAAARMSSAHRLTIARVKGYHPKYTGKTMRQMLVVLKGKLKK
jgi:ABC-type transport system involved in cytochrome bd biosynthesis fused ATPase/permease subunit